MDTALDLLKRGAISRSSKPFPGTAWRLRKADLSCDRPERRSPAAWQVRHPEPGPPLPEGCLTTDKRTLRGHDGTGRAVVSVKVRAATDPTKFPDQSEAREAAEAAE